MTIFAAPCRANGDLFGPVGPSMSFGFITDTHHDPIKPMDNAKYYKDAVNKVTAAVAAFNARKDLSFVFQNGDFIDGSNDAPTALNDLATIKAVFDQANAPRYHNLGNHEMWKLTKAQVLSVTGQPGKWYSFVRNDVTFIVLDGNFTSDDDSADLDPSTPDNLRSPYISYIPPTQRAWLADTIAASPYPCVIFCHYPVFYSGASSWGLTNAAAVRNIINAASPKVIACVCGHIHDNYIRRSGSTLYVTLDAGSTNAYPAVNYSIVTVYPKTRQIKVIGYGYHMSSIAA